MSTHARVRLFHQLLRLSRSVPALLLAAALQSVQADGAGAETPDQRLVGLWLGLQGKYQFPAECESGAPVRYTADGKYAGPGARGTWRLRDDRLTETTTEVDEELDGDPAWISKPYVSDIVWEGPDTFVKTFADGSRMTFRRCPETVTPAGRTHSADADSPVREQIARACENKPGKIEPASVIERDLTGDGKTDLIIHHHGIECDGGGRSIFCGAQECSANLYVRRGAQLHPAGEFGAVEWIKIEGGKVPTIHTISHGGKPLALRWNGREFRVVSAQLPSAPAARSKAADYLVREQIAAACDGKQGTIDPAAAIEQDLTGDGRADLIISHEGISCANGGRSNACGAQLCSVMIYVRRGALLKLEREMLGVGVSAGEGKVPEISMYAHGGTLHSMKWNGRTFRPVVSRRAAQEPATAPATPNGHGRIEGELSFPGDHIPDDMIVCAENVLTKRNHCDSKRKRGRDSDSYTLIVPPGKYRVYAKTTAMPNVLAYYSDFVTCGLDAKCRSHKPIVVEVTAGATVKSVHPQDWYVRRQHA